MQKNNWDISNVIFDTLQRETITNLIHLYDSYKTEEFQMPIYDELIIGDLAPEIKGKFINQNTDTTIKFNKITILEFWFKSCVYCTQVIPILNQLQNRFKDSLQIIGINPIDEIEFNDIKMKKHLKEFGMEYPTLFTSGKISEQYKIHSYPTIILLDTYGTIKFVQIGLDEDVYKLLEAEILKL